MRRSRQLAITGILVAVILGLFISDRVVTAQKEREAEASREEATVQARRQQAISAAATTAARQELQAAQARQQGTATAAAARVSATAQAQATAEAGATATALAQAEAARQAQATQQAQAARSQQDDATARAVQTYLRENFGTFPAPTSWYGNITGVTVRGDTVRAQTNLPLGFEAADKAPKMCVALMAFAFDPARRNLGITSVMVMASDGDYLVTSTWLSNFSCAASNSLRNVTGARPRRPARRWDGSW